MTNSTMTDDDTGRPMRPDENLTPWDLLETARRAVRDLRSSQGLPARVESGSQDVVADVVDTCLTTQGRGAVVTARDVRRVVHRLARQDDAPNADSVRDLRRLTQAIVELEQRQGHIATPAQVNQLAVRIVEGWEQSSRQAACSGQA